MTLWYFAPVDPYTARSGGTRKLADHVEILREHGIDAQVAIGFNRPRFYKPDDIIVMPEVYGSYISDPNLAPSHIRRMSFVQNGYLIDTYRVDARKPHPWYATPSLVGILTESDHSTDLVKLRCPDLQVPIIRTHSCGNAIAGKPRGLTYGEWPRRKVVMYFGYKHSKQNQALFERSNWLPDGWEFQQLQGSDDEVNQALMTGSIFCAPNANEGMCAPASEAMIAGCVVVGWPGGPSRSYSHDPTPEWAFAIAPDPNTTVGGPIEYLDGRAVLVPQDDTGALLAAVFQTATELDAGSDWPQRTADYSAFFQKTYDRQTEVDELVNLMRGLGA